MRVQSATLLRSNFLSFALPLFGCKYLAFLSPVNATCGPVYKGSSDTEIKCRPTTYQNCIILPNSQKTCEKFDFIKSIKCWSLMTKHTSSIKLLNTDSRAYAVRLKMEANLPESSADRAASPDKNTDIIKPKRTSPTHFISVQISNPEILKALSDVQQAVLKAEENLETAMVSVATAHLTLMVIRLETEEEIQKAGVSLERCLTAQWSDLVQGSEVLELEVAGLGHFDHHVMFAKITPGKYLDQLYKIAESVEMCLLEDGIKKADPKPFKPHLTLMKFTRERANILRKKGIKKIDPKFYEEFLDKTFGLDVLKSFQLCSMSKPKDPETGYYHIEHEIVLGKSKEDN